MEAAARQLLQMGARAVLLKGGHLPGDTVSDLLLTGDAQLHWMREPRIATAQHARHRLYPVQCDRRASGVGSAAAVAVDRARDYVRGALAAGAAVRTGAGSGPLNHSYAPQPMRLHPLR